MNVSNFTVFVTEFLEERYIFMNEEMITRQAILKEQLAENQNTAKLLWRLYRAEMMRLIENPTSQPDVSILERFIENESGTFGLTLAQLFIDAIKFGSTNADVLMEGLLYDRQ